MKIVVVDMGIDPLVTTKLESQKRPGRGNVIPGIAEVFAKKAEKNVQMGRSVNDGREYLFVGGQTG